MSVPMPVQELFLWRMAALLPTLVYLRSLPPVAAPGLQAQVQ
jgi:hypothetical protein